MRNFLFIILCLCAVNVSAQMTFTEANPTATTTTTTVTVAGKTFTGGTSRSGSLYIIRTSGKTGKEYKAYLGTPTEHRHEGQTVFTNKAKDKYFYYVISKNGYPTPKQLTAN